MKKILFLFVAICAVLSVSSQDRVLQSGTNTGVSYTLPASAFVVTVSVERNDFFPGPLQKYAASLMGIENSVKSRKTTYRLTGANIKAITVNDLTTMNMLNFVGERSSKELKTGAVSMHSNGTLAGINSEIGAADNSVAFSYSVPVWDDTTPDFDYLLAGPNQKTITDTIVQLITVDTATIKDVTYKHKLVERSEEDKARDVVATIMKIRSDRISLLTGYQEVAYSEGTISYMDGQFKEMEEAYLSLFRGQQNHQESSYTFIVVPSFDDYNKDITLCGFSETTGVNLTGRTAGQGITLTFSGDALPKSESPEKSGVTYRIPVTAVATLSSGSTQIGGGIFTVPQFGPVMTAPVSVQPGAIIDPATGAATKVVID